MSAGGDAARPRLREAAGDVSADCRLLLSVGLRVDGAGGTGWLDRVVLPAPARFAESLRSVARPHRRFHAVRPYEREGAEPAPLRPGDQRLGDDVAHPDRVADRHRSPRDAADAARTAA